MGVARPIGRTLATSRAAARALVVARRHESGAVARCLTGDCHDRLGHGGRSSDSVVIGGISDVDSERVGSSVARSGTKRNDSSRALSDRRPRRACNSNSSGRSRNKCGRAEKT